MPRSRPQTERSAEAARLRRLREATGFAQRDLADAFNVAPGAVAQWEGGDRTIPGPVLRLLEVYEQELGIAPQPVAPESSLRTSWLSRNAGNARAAAVLLLFHGADSVAPSFIAGRIKDAAVRDFAKTLAGLKGLSMKLAQMAPYKDLVLPAEHQRALSTIQDVAPPMPPLMLLDTFLTEFGSTPRELFGEWSNKPVAVASIGQVHSAVLSSGERVAVKVQHPRIVQMLEADLRNLAAIDRVMTLVWPAQERGVLYEEIRARLLDECNYVLEADATAFFRHAFRDRDDMFIPKVIEGRSSRRVLTTTWAPGAAFDEFAASASQEDRDRVGATIFDFHYQSIFVHGRLNTDPQPGNYLIGPGVVSFLDFGRVKVWSKEARVGFRRMIRALLERDLAAYRDSLIALRCVPDPSTFDFHYSFRAMLFFFKPCLVDEPFQFTPGFIARMWKLYAVENPNRARTNYTADMAFLDQFYFGVGALLARLNARVACRTRLLDLVYARGDKRPDAMRAGELEGLGVN